ncbi:MYXO-CTERM sorting domain-containing protein [Stenotrophomonas indicatrix]|uniref:MYXO-CTERM sorting domain-containing protein n=1 Tax=Stenotrophomonas indicatrix TaxID=2045451 RepID=UPI003CD02FAD
MGRTPEGGSRRVLPTHTTPPNPQKPRAALALALALALASARRRRTTARQRGTSTSNPIGQLTPVPPMPQ